MSFWDWAENFGEKLGNTLDKTADVIFAGPGLAVDIAKATIDGRGGKTYGDAFDNAAKNYRGAADLLIDNGTITGYGVNQLAKASEYVYRKEITPLVTQPATYVTHGIQTGDFSEDSFEAAGEAVKTAGAGGDDMTIAQSIAMVGSAAGGEIGQAIGTGEGDLQIDPLGDDPNAKDWDDYQSLLRKHAGSEDAVAANILTGLGDAAATWYADPAYLALKPIGALRRLRRDAPLSAKAAAEVGKAMDRSANHTAKTYGLPKKLLMNDQADRVEAVIGRIDETGTYTPGYIRGLNAAQIQKAFPTLEEVPFGNQAAAWLAKTNKIEDDATRLNVQKDLLALTYGDLGALKRIQATREEGQKFADGFDSLADEVDDAVSGRVTGTTQARAAEAAGLTPAWGADVSTVAEAKRKLANIPGALDVENLFGVLQKNTLAPTAAGKRSLARFNDEGLGRDGTMHTGYDVVDKTLGKPVEALVKTGKRINDEVNNFSHKHLMRNGLLSPPVKLVKGAFWDLPMKTVGFGYKASDKMRQPANPGLMNLFNTGHLGGVLDGEMRRAGVDDATRKNYLARMTSVAEGDSHTAKAITEEAEQEMVKSLARKYEINEEYITELTRSIQDKRSRHFGSIQEQQAQSFAPSGDVSGRRVKLEDGTDRPLRADEYPTIVDEDGVITAVEPAPFWDTQRVHATSLLDIKDLDRTLARRQKLLKDMGDDWYETKRGRFGKKAFDALYNPEGVDASHQFTAGMDALNKYWKAGTLLRLGYPLRILGDDQMRMMATGQAASIWGVILKNGLPSKLKNRDGAIRRGLLAEKSLLEERVIDPDLTARLKSEVDEIQALNKRIDAGETDLIPDRDMLMEQSGNMDIYQDEARLAEIKRMLQQNKFDSEKGTLASGKINVQGVELEDAYGSNQGLMSKNIVENGAVLDNHVQGVEDGALKQYRQSGSWRDVTPEEPGYMTAWSHSINRQVRSSRLAKIFLDGGTTEDALKFLRTTHEGRAIARRHPAFAGDKERWVNNMEQVINDLMPTPELRQIAAKRDLTRADLEAAVPDQAMRPVVNGGSVDANMGTGQNARNLNAAINKIFHYIAEVPSNAMSRHPLFISHYRREADRLAQLYRENGRIVDGKIDIEDVNRIQEQARKSADHHVRKTLFNVASQSDAATTMRYLSPFFAAWQESMHRWGRIASDNPEVVRRFQMAFDAPRNLGLTVDEEGNLVEPGSFPEGNNRILLQLPHAWGGKDTSDPRNRTGMTVGESSFNLIFNGGGILNPGFGPIAQIPTSVLAKQWADKKHFSHLSKAVLPFGPTEGVLDPLVPATAKRAHTLYTAYAPWVEEHSSEFNAMYATNLQEKIVDFELEKGRAPSMSEQRKLEKQAESETGTLAVWRFINSGVSPAPAMFNGKYEGLRQEFRRLQEKGQAENKDQSWATEQFVKQYGAEFFALTKSRSQNPGQLSATAETVEGVKYYKDTLRVVNPKLYRMVLGEKNKEGFSEEAYRHLQSARGSEGTYISKKNPEQAARDAVVAQGWNEYSKFLTWANAKAADMGFKSYRDSDDLKDFIQFAKGAIAEENPQWYADLTSFNPEEYNELLGDMKTIASDKKLNSDPLRAGGQKALSTYLGVREQIAAELERRAAAGGRSTIQAKDNADLRDYLDFTVSTLIEESIDFERHYYATAVERDPWLSDDMEEAS